MWCCSIKFSKIFSILFNRSGKKANSTLITKQNGNPYSAGNLFEKYNVKCETDVQGMHFGASKRKTALHTGLRYHSGEGRLISQSFATGSDNMAHQAHQSGHI